jgi:fatty-acyl-CoA synthase
LKRKIHFDRQSSGMTLHQQKQPMPEAGGKTSALQDWVRALEATAPIARNPERLLSDVIAELAEAHGNAPALLSIRESFTYRELAERANRYARWALAQNLAKGDAVALIMPNRPEYAAIWLGITSVGGVVSLINTNLRSGALAHCLNIVTPKHVIVDAELLDAFDSAAGQIEARPKIWSHGSEVFHPIDRAIESFSGMPLTAAEKRHVTISDRALHIYTSGTTGLPKAAKVSHRRLLQWSFWFAGLMNTGPDDRMYDCLPMYHSVGGVVAIGALLARGGSVVIREKFSAREFWSDIARWDCSLFQYIGELCRYLANETEMPTHHRLRIACGNGLRADVWEKFQQKFRIPRVLEFYAATEANVSLYNVEGKVGAIGKVPPFLKHRSPLALVKFDHTLDEPVRGADGFCIRCATDEAGEALGRIEDGPANSQAFEGYTDDAATEKKILRDVFERGDAWFRTGDLMRQDGGGFCYFVDRIGDTFRWKGENVSASEVTAALAEFPGILEATVYGVPVPGADGAAGMAALVTDGPLDFTQLHAHLAQQLPAYAQPLFLRIQDRIAVTGTFKHQKADLVREGFDPVATPDAVYFCDPTARAYVRIDTTLFERIRTGAIRF